MNYAVVGTGYWGENHVRVAAELREEGLLDEVVVCDVDEKRAAAVADAFGLDYETDPGTLARRGVDAATVATPSPTHGDVASGLLADGVDLLVEKPIALDGATAWELVRTAEEHGRTLGAGHIFRFHPAVAELKRSIDRGDLGQIRYLNTNRFTFRVPRANAGALYSLAVHDVDLYTHLLDRRPDSVYARCDSFVRDGVDETATVTLGFGETTGLINASWQVPVFGKQRHLVVVGSERVAFLDYLEHDRLELYESRVFEDGDGRLVAREEGKRVKTVTPREPLKSEIESFVRAVRDGGEFAAPGRVGAATVDLLDLARRSSEEGRPLRPDADEPVSLARRADD